MKERKAREATPTEELARLASVLASPKLPKGVVLRGDERYFREAALDMILQALRNSPWELVRHDAEDPDFSLRGLCDDLVSPSMFAPARAVLVRGAARLLKKEGSRESEFARAALSFLENASLAGVLIVDGEGLRADSSLVKAVLASGGLSLHLRRLWDTPPPWDPDPRKTELVQWTLARSRERGLKLGLDEALYVAVATGNDLSAIDTELSRVAHRGSASVKSLVPWAAGASPFQVSEQLLAGDAPRALAGLEALFHSGFQSKDGSRETDSAALLSILLSSLRGRAMKTYAVALDARALEECSNPRERSELETRAQLRSARAWQAFVEDCVSLERRTRSGQGVDVHDLFALALRHRLEPRSKAAPPARRMG